MTNGYPRNTPTYSFEIFGIEAVTAVLNFTAVENISSPFDINVSLLSKGIRGTSMISFVKGKTEISL